MTEERFAGWQEGHPARSPHEERCPELVLERADLAAHRRLRDAQALGGATYVPFFGDGDEVADLSETHGPSVPRRADGGKAWLGTARSKRYWTSAASPCIS